VIAETCDYVYVMYGGRVIESGPTDAVLSRPRHPYTYFLLRCQPRLDGQIPGRLPTIPGMQGSRLVGEEAVGCSFAPRCQFADAVCEAVEPALEHPDGGSPASVACHRWRQLDLDAALRPS
jgi:oligopeptide/dipeptide ABC transporter ATP-binding protein